MPKKMFVFCLSVSAFFVDSIKLTLRVKNLCIASDFYEQLIWNYKLKSEIKIRVCNT